MDTRYRFAFAFAILIMAVTAGAQVNTYDGLHLSATDITRLHSMGVKPEYIKQIKELGYPSTTDIIRLHSVGVKPEYIRQLKELGSPDISASDIIKFHTTGVRPEYIKQLKESGIQHPAAARTAAPPAPPLGISSHTSLLETISNYAAFIAKMIALAGLILCIGYIAYRYRDRLLSARNRAEETVDARLATFEQRVNDLQDILLSIDDRLDRRLKRI